jgi:hypothetical protein
MLNVRMSRTPIEGSPVPGCLTPATLCIWCVLFGSALGPAMLAQIGSVRLASYYYNWSTKWYFRLAIAEKYLEDLDLSGEVPLDCKMHYHECQRRVLMMVDRFDVGSAHCSAC